MCDNCKCVDFKSVEIMNIIDKWDNETLIQKIEELLRSSDISESFGSACRN